MGYIVILGIFVADTTYRAERQPKMGETILGNSFALGPGGKGSNQAVAAGKAGAEVHMLTRLGPDDFGRLAQQTWANAGVTSAAEIVEGAATGAAFIFVSEATGDNAIIVAPGVAATLSGDFVASRTTLIEGAAVFVTQLEQPVDAALTGLRIARAAGVTTILNPAPAADISDAMIALCDYITPNETEAAALAGLPVTTLPEAEAAARALIAKGAGAVILTLGEKGALYVSGKKTLHVPAMTAGPVVETTGAGDAFNGGFAAALARGATPEDALRFATATAAISVTRAGAAPSMPAREEVDDLLRQMS